VAQRLVRKVCPHCAVPHQPQGNDLNLLGISYDQAHVPQWRIGTGCSKCFNSGYSGREAVIELLDIDDTIRHIIYEGSLTQLHRYLHQCGFESFRKAAIAKVTAGLTTMAEIRRVLPYSAFNRRAQGQEGVPFKANLRRASLHRTF
jgi:type II secretory ATPase GspE/PulE/Tfp pilus assembly ATPase PilB-like protein